MKRSVIARLQTGSIGNVVAFDESLIPSPPYVVVKIESADGQRRIRLIAHDNVGNSDTLEDYILNECSTLLKNWVGTDSKGNTFKVKDAEEYTDVIPENDDNTIAMERVFYVPSRLH